MTNKPSWQDEYDNIFGIKHYQVCVGKKCSCHKEVKSFIQDLFNRKVKKIEGLIYIDGTPGYNQGLLDALSILKEE